MRGGLVLATTPHRNRGNKPISHRLDRLGHIYRVKQLGPSSFGAGAFFLSICTEAVLCLFELVWHELGMSSSPWDLVRE